MNRAIRFLFYYLLSYSCCFSTSLSTHTIRLINVLPANDFYASLGIIKDSCFGSKSTFRLWKEMKSPIKKEKDEPFFLFKEKVAAYTALYLMNRCFAKMNSYQMNNYQFLRNQITYIISTLNESSLLSAHSVESSLDSIHLVYNGEEWYEDHQYLFTKLSDVLVYIPKLFGKLKYHNITMIDKVGKGVYGTVYKVSHVDCSHNTSYFALKYFNCVNDCMAEECIMKILNSLHGSNIAQLKLNNLVNCKKHACILMEFIDGFTVNKVPQHIVQQHRFGLFGFVSDFINSVKQNVFDLMDQNKTHNIRIYHSDLSTNNVMYNPTKQQFYVIDWGLAHDLNNNKRDCFLGQYQYFGSAGWILMTRIETCIISKKYKFSDTDWTLGHLNDYYAVSSIALELLTIYGQHLLHLDDYKLLKELEHFIYDKREECNEAKTEQAWWMNTFLLLDDIWWKRRSVVSKLAYNLDHHYPIIRSSSKNSRKFSQPRERTILHEILNDTIIYDIECLDIWFLRIIGLTHSMDVSDLLDLVENKYTKQLMIVVEQNKLSARYNDMHAILWMMSPDYVKNRNEEETFEMWTKQNKNLLLKYNIEYDLDNICIAQMTFQLLNLYYETFNNQYGIETGENVELMHVIKMILKQFDELGHLDYVHSLFYILPKEMKQHSLYQQLTQLLTPHMELKNVNFSDHQWI
eukprot:476242_1